MNKRVWAKENTRQKAITAARKAFAVTDYHAVSIRDLAKAMGMSTGAIFANFTSKADLWQASMPLAVPADDQRTRANMYLIAAAMASREALRAIGGESAVVEGALKRCEIALELAQSPLDGDVWARHLAAKAGVDAPRFPSPQAASLAPSDDAAAQA